MQNWPAAVETAMAGGRKKVGRKGGREGRREGRRDGVLFEQAFTPSLHKHTVYRCWC